MNKNIDLINNTVVKHEIFNLFDNARELYNIYYVLHNGNYTEEDYNNIKRILLALEENLIDLKKEID